MRQSVGCHYEKRKTKKVSLTIYILFRIVVSGGHYTAPVFELGCVFVMAVRHRQLCRNHLKGANSIMKLYITRDQAKGMFGGVKFELKARVELTGEESGLVSKYKADKEVLIQKEIKIPFTGKAIILDINIGSLVSGQEFKCKDIADILEYEKNVKEACESFKNYIEVMKSFGGEQVVNY